MHTFICSPETTCISQREQREVPLNKFVTMPLNSRVVSHQAHTNTTVIKTHAAFFLVVLRTKLVPRVSILLPMKHLDGSF